LIERRGSSRVAPLALFALLYVGAEVVRLRIAGIGDAEQSIAAGVYVALSLATWFFTRSKAGPVAETRETKPRSLGAQFAIVAVVVLFTGFIGAAFNGVVRGVSLPALFMRLGSFGIPQFALYVGIPALALSAFGVHGRGVWVRLGDRGWIAAGATWVAPFAIALAIGVAQHPASLGRLTWRIATNVFQNGFSEEFLFRGVLLTRLRFVMRDGWALFAQAIVFGMWHYGADMREAHGDLIYAIALMITSQASFGYAIGFLALRSRSLLFPSIAHALADAF
jgi:membrane protease YdiL (CAAX protease family)